MQMSAHRAQPHCRGTGGLPATAAAPSLKGDQSQPPLQRAGQALARQNLMRRAPGARPGTQGGPKTKVLWPFRERNDLGSRKAALKRDPTATRPGGGGGLASLPVTHQGSHQETLKMQEIISPLQRKEKRTPPLLNPS